MSSEIAHFIVPKSDQKISDKKMIPHPKKLHSVLYYALIIISVIIGICLISKVFKYNTISSALAAQGWVLYTRPGCVYCHKQLKILNDPEYPRHVRCLSATACDPTKYLDTRAPMRCNEVNAYPYWINAWTRAIRIGLQSTENLKNMCQGS